MIFEIFAIRRAFPRPEGLTFDDASLRFGRKNHLGVKCPKTPYSRRFGTQRFEQRCIFYIKDRLTVAITRLCFFMNILEFCPEWRIYLQSMENEAIQNQHYSSGMASC